MVAYIRCAVSCLLATLFATPLLAEPEPFHKTAAVVSGLLAEEGSDSLSLLQVNTGARPAPVVIPTSSPVEPDSAAQLSPFPDIGGAVGSAVDKATDKAKDTVSGVVNSTISKSKAALVKPLAEALNSTLVQVEEKVDSVLATVTLKKEALLQTAQASWGDFTSQLNDTLSVSLSMWDQIPWTSITGTIKTVGASGLVPASMTSALDTLESFADTLSNSTAIAQILLKKQDIAYSEAEEKLGSLNATLNNGLSMVAKAEETLKASFVKLVSNVQEKIGSMALISKPSDPLEILKSHVETITDKSLSAADTIVSGVNQSIPTALGKLQGAFGSARMPAAAGLGSLLASLAAMAVATEGGAL